MRRTQTPQIPEPARAPGRLCCGPRETVTWALPLISFPCTRAQATDGVPAHCCTCHVQRWKGYGRCPRNSGGGPGRETQGRWVRGCPDGGPHRALQGTTQGAGEEADKLGAEEPVQRLLGDEDEEEPWEAGGRRTAPREVAGLERGRCGCGGCVWCSSTSQNLWTLSLCSRTSLLGIPPGLAKLAAGNSPSQRPLQLGHNRATSNDRSSETAVGDLISEASGMTRGTRRFALGTLLCPAEGGNSGAQCPRPLQQWPWAPHWGETRPCSCPGASESALRLCWRC